MGKWQGTGITESSGMAYSRKWATEHLAYVHNDEDGALCTVDLDTGATVGKTGIKGHSLVDPESIDIDPTGMLWWGDLGDNPPSSRSSIVIYSLPEPGRGFHGDKTWRRFVCKYPDGTARNAETLIVWPNGTKEIISKVAKGAVYRLPKTLSQTSVNKLTVSHKPDARLDFVSDAVAQHDGRFAFVIRKDHNSTISVFSNKWQWVKDFSMPAMKKPEGITIQRDGKYLWVCDDNGGPGGHYQRVKIPSKYWPKTASTPKPPSTPGTPEPTPTPTPEPTPLPMSPCGGAA